MSFPPKNACVYIRVTSELLYSCHIKVSDAFPDRRLVQRCAGVPDRGGASRNYSPATDDDDSRPRQRPRSPLSTVVLSRSRSRFARSRTIWSRELHRRARPPVLPSRKPRGCPRNRPEERASPLRPSYLTKKKLHPLPEIEDGLPNGGFPALRSDPKARANGNLRRETYGFASNCESFSTGIIIRAYAIFRPGWWQQWLVKW